MSAEKKVTSEKKVTLNIASLEEAKEDNLEFFLEMDDGEVDIRVRRRGDPGDGDLVAWFSPDPGGIILSRAEDEDLRDLGFAMDKSDRIIIED
jgi:hypothetical protein